MNKRAIIIGSNGQDGTLLLEFLIKKKYLVLGIDRDSIRACGISWKQKIDILDKNQVELLVKKIKPDEIYYLAAFHQSSQDKQIEDVELFCQSYQINVFALINFLEGIRLYSPKTKLFYASSSMIFGDNTAKKQSEKTSYNPNTIYGITKLDGLLICRYYRELKNIFASVGILYNHESALRPNNFVFKKVIQGAIDIKNKHKKELVVGDFDAGADWGYAPDFVIAMHKILSLHKPGEYIVATGKKHTVRDLVSRAFGDLGLDWKKIVTEDSKILTRNKKILVGDSNKIYKSTGWKPSLSFDEMISLVIKQIQSKK